MSCPLTDGERLAKRRWNELTRLGKIHFPECNEIDLIIGHKNKKLLVYRLCKHLKYDIPAGYNVLDLSEQPVLEIPAAFQVPGGSNGVAGPAPVPMRSPRTTLNRKAAHSRDNLPGPSRHPVVAPSGPSQVAGGSNGVAGPVRSSRAAPSKKAPYSREQRPRRKNLNTKRRIKEEAITHRGTINEGTPESSPELEDRRAEFGARASEDTVRDTVEMMLALQEDLDSLTREKNKVKYMAEDLHAAAKTLTQRLAIERARSERLLTYLLNWQRMEKGWDFESIFPPEGAILRKREASWNNQEEEVDEADADEDPQLRAFLDAERRVGKGKERATVSEDEDAIMVDVAEPFTISEKIRPGARAPPPVRVERADGTFAEVAQIVVEDHTHTLSERQNAPKMSDQPYELNVYPMGPQASGFPVVLTFTPDPPADPNAPQLPAQTTIIEASGATVTCTGGLTEQELDDIFAGMPAAAIRKRKKSILDRPHLKEPRRRSETDS